MKDTSLDRKFHEEPDFATQKVPNGQGTDDRPEENRPKMTPGPSGGGKNTERKFQTKGETEKGQTNRPNIADQLPDRSKHECK